MKKAISTKMFILIMIPICISLNACEEISKNDTATQKTEQTAALLNPSGNAKPESAESRNITSGNIVSANAESGGTKSEEILSGQTHWQVYICPDMPQPYIEVLKQYEQFMNADNQNFNDETVQSKLRDEWKYLYDEICMAWTSAIKREPPEKTENLLRYALADLTGDGFPELVIAYGSMPDVIYNYSETKGIGMECLSSYYDMTIYKNGIVEYVSGGAYSSTTYLQFQEDVQGWVIVDRIAVSDTWDAANERMNDTAYYVEERGADGLYHETIITEEEYRNIQEKYVTEPMEFEWIPLAYSPQDFSLKVQFKNQAHSGSCN